MKASLLLLTLTVIALCAGISLPSPLLLISNSKDVLSTFVSIENSLKDFIASATTPSVVVVYNSASRTLAKSKLLQDMTNQMESVYVPPTNKGELSGAELVNNALSQLPSTKVSSKDQLAQLTISENVKLSKIEVSLPNDLEEAEAWIQSIQSTISNYNHLSIFTFSSDDIRTEFRLRKRSTPEDTRGLFELYSFFSAGIWMGIIVGVMFLIILVSGILCLTSLQTPTKFEKNQ